MKTSIKRLLLLFILLVFLVSGSYAKYVQTCNVKYRANYGWSDYYSVQVTFISGSELNDATNSYDYDSYDTYAIIFWGKDEATVIEISSYTGCGSVVSQGCITNSITNLEGEDQQGIDWEVCVDEPCI